MTDPKKNYRSLEDSIHTDFKKDMSYGDYLNLDQVLSAQHPISDEHDEYLFIIIHQASELWIKLMGHELVHAIEQIKQENFGRAFKDIARCKQILNQLMQSWGILATLTPHDYLKFRDKLGKSSGFQSYGYRQIEFLLGNKNESLMKVHKSKPDVYAMLKKHLEEPSLYDVVIRVLSKRGFDIDKACLERDFSQPYQHNQSVEKAWLAVYREADSHFPLYDLAEKLVDLEDAFQQWRYRHMYTVQRIIGHKQGTGGSSGVGFLKKALEMSFFPELFSVRTIL
jgi:tryptophan 2,3-dioxygenase